MIYVTGGIKGGSGKSTVAINLAIKLVSAGRDVLLVDADDQETATDFTYLRNEKLEGNAGYTAIQLTDKAVRNQILRQKDKYDDIVIDTGGRDTASQRAALSIADIFLVPFVPRSFDVWTLERVSDLVDDISSFNPDVRAYTFLNRADPRGTDNEEAQEQLKDCDALEFINCPIGYRKAFSHASASGLGVAEYRPTDLKAIAEFDKLFEFCFDVKKTLK
jgi:chromosome partitioning protein